MTRARALGVSGDGKGIVELEEKEIPPDLVIFRHKIEVYLEKKSFDLFVEKVRKEKGIRFTLTGYRIHKVDPKNPKSKAYYVFPKVSYKPFAILLKLPAWNTIEERRTQELDAI
jgi:hypothetical protein